MEILERWLRPFGVTKSDPDAICGTPPGSPNDEAPKSPAQEQLTAELAGSAPPPMSLVEFRKLQNNLAFFQSISQAEEVLKLKRITTQSYNNCCLIFSYLVVTKEIKPRDQLLACVPCSNVPRGTPQTRTPCAITQNLSLCAGKRVGL